MLPGFEFLIAFESFDVLEMEGYLKKFPDRPRARDESPHFELRLEKEGMYFHDIARSDFSAKTLRTLIELALEFSEVRLVGFGPSNIPELPGRLVSQACDHQRIITRVT